MKNREYRVLLAVALMAAMVAGGVRGTTMYTYAADNGAKTAEVDTEAANDGETAPADSSARAKKDETVYIKTDGNGNAKNVTVSDQLKNISDFAEIEDISDLADIENVKGDETFTQKDGKLVWAGEQKEICYQGTTSRKLPVGIKITYVLDGKEISAEELEGKSGHLAIRYEYQNMTASEGAYTPFAMVTGLILDTEKFGNVTIDNGKLISDGERNIVIGMGIPNMKEQLEVDDLDIPDSFTVEADVTEYEAVRGITVATNDIFNQITTDKLDDLDDLQASMAELQNASSQLVDGSGELKDGLNTLLEASGTLISGIGDLAAGGDSLAGGTGILLGGANDLLDGSRTLAGGTSQLAKGADDLNAGAVQVADGAKSAYGGSGQLLAGAKQLNDGVAEMQKKAGAGAKALGDGVGALKGGIEQAAAGASSLKDGIDNAAAGAAALNAGLADAAAGAGKLSDGAVGIQTNLKAIAAQNDNSDVIQALRALEAGMDDSVKAQIEGVIAGLEQRQQKVNGAIGQVADGAASLGTNASGLAMQLGTEGQLGGGAAALTSGIERLQGGAVSLNTALNENLRAGADQLASGVGEMAGTLDAGTKELADGTGALLKGTTDLNSGLGSLNDGASKLSVGSAALSDNMKAADNGAKDLSAGADKLAKGAKDLDSGAGTLAQGLGTLKNGSGELTDGVQLLADGAKELNEGMIKFDEEGIQKLVNAFDGDIDGLLGRLNEMLDASRSYRNFSGISDDMNGEVKFIFVTDK